MTSMKSILTAWGLSAGVLLSSHAAAPPLVLSKPPTDAPIAISVAVPTSVSKAVAANPGALWRLAPEDSTSPSVAVEFTPALSAEGIPLTEELLLLGCLPPGGEASSPRRFRLVQGPSSEAGATARGFRFADVDSKSLGLWEGERPVLVYNHGVLLPPGVPADRQRSTYVHPLYGLDGEVLTDDFPKDHYHHRGLFWAWPHVRREGKHYDLWALQGIEQRFERWLDRQAGQAGAVLGVENGWYVGDKKVVQERAWLRVHAATGDERVIDLDFTWIPLGEPLALAGAEGKSYGGLTLRFGAGTNVVITTPLGNEGRDLAMTRLQWADLTALFKGAAAPSGAAIFIGADHPDYPPTWLTRHYGVLCLGWPGVEARTFEPAKPIRCKYRLWVHRGPADGSKLARAYSAYLAATNVSCSIPAQTSAASTAPSGAVGKGQPVRAQIKSDRVTVHVGEKPFTEYIFPPDSKYPYFYPVNGPKTGRSVTVHRTEPYPHHSSIFFGCDRVNGGNYWQEGLDRGRIVSTQIQMIRDAGDSVVWEQHCSWERPNAPPPFSDRRRIAISAPGTYLRFIDFDIALTAETEVTIEKNNHSLFSARVDPVLAVKGGGTLVNAHGDTSEKGTFGKAAPWAHYWGKWDNAVEGVAILCHPQDRWFPPPWFTRDYGFMSPTPMFWLENDRLLLHRGESVRLRYRVIVHAGELSPDQVQGHFDDWQAGRSGV